ncbi:MAG TPA: YdbH domain-containing protein, partial [Methylococcaceae bacterium]|nr:YdbH domain-containing protein [Methylococcaceae bacterium]
VDAAQARLDYTLAWQWPVLHAVVIGQAKLVWQASPAEGSPGSGGTRGAGRIVLPFERLEVARLEVDVATPLGRSLFSGATEIAVAADGAMEARFRDSGQALRLNLPPSGERASLVGESAGGAPIFRAAANRLADRTLRATLDADARPLVEWLAASALLPDRLRTQVAGLPALRDGLGRLGPQLALTLDTDPGGGPIRLNGRLLHEGQAIALLQADRSADGVLNADLRLSAPLAVLSPLAVPLLPPRAVPWWPQSGTARGRAQLQGSGDSWTGTAYLEADGVGLQRETLSIADGTLRLNVSDVRAGAVEFSAGLPSLRLGEKLEAHHLGVRGQYRPGRLALQQAGARLFGGAVDVVPADLDLNRRPYALTLRLTDIDLEPLLRSLERKELSGTGRIGGELPLRIDETGLAIDDGALSGHGPGVLRYRGPAADPDNIAFKALRNLAYHTLKARLDYGADGEYRIGLRLEGNNPELLEGYPIAFNLNLSGQLSELVRAGLLSGDWDRSILEQAEKQRRNGAH